MYTNAKEEGETHRSSEKKKKNEVMEVFVPNSWSYFTAIFPRAVIFQVK